MAKGFIVIRASHKTVTGNACRSRKLLVIQQVGINPTLLKATSCRNEQLCRYITRPAIANERLTLNSAGDVVLQLKSPYQDGTTHIVMSPLGELKPKIL